MRNVTFPLMERGRPPDELIRIALWRWLTAHESATFCNAEIRPADLQIAERSINMRTGRKAVSRSISVVSVGDRFVGKEIIL